MVTKEDPNEDNYISRLTSVLDTSTLENEIKAQIDDIMQLVTRLGNLLTNKERSKITKELNDVLKKVINRNRNTRLRKKQNENILLRLVKQHNSSSKKERYMDLDYDDLQYQGISDFSNLIYPISINLYYELELLHSSFDRGYEK